MRRLLEGGVNWRAASIVLPVYYDAAFTGGGVYWRAECICLPGAGCIKGV